MTKTFSADISKFAEKVRLKGDAFLRTVAQELAKQIIIATPVRTGFARASWWASVGGLGGHPNTPDKSNYSQPQPGTDTTSRPFALMVLEIGKANLGDTVYISNNASYIMDLEQGRSKQAPAGMVGVTLAKAQAIAEDVAKRIK